MSNEPKKRPTKLVAIIFILVCALATTGVLLKNHSNRQMLQGQEEKIVKLREQIAESRVQVQTAAQDIGVGDGGLDKTRVLSDQGKIKEILSGVFTFDSGPSYEDGRAKINAKYHLEETGLMKNVVLPADYNEDDSGKRYYYIDAMGFNSTLDSDVVITTVSNVAGRYTYLVESVSTITQDSIKEGSRGSAITGSQRVFSKVVIEPDGTISTFDSAVSSSSPKSAG